VSGFDPTDLRHSAGFGLRLGSGGFLLRFDLGLNLDPQPAESHSVFYFAIGQAF
jgi:outer membrane protein assembly factor BamA